MVDNRYEFEYPDEAGYPDGTGFLSQDQKILIDQVIDADEGRPEAEILVVENEEESSYQAISGDTLVGELKFTTEGDRVTLISATVPDLIQLQGIATELIRQVLDIVRAQNKTITILCPIIRMFINRNPEYEALVDQSHPGVRSATG